MSMRKDTLCNTLKPVLLLFIVLLPLFLIYGCTAEELPPPNGPDCNGLETSYVLNIQQIVDNACAYAGCHPEYRTYEGLLPVLEDGLFRSRVITLQADPVLGMPRDDAPADKPADLSEEDLQLIECWLNEDYPRE